MDKRSVSTSLSVRLLNPLVKAVAGNARRVRLTGKQRLTGRVDWSPFARGPPPPPDNGTRTRFLAPAVECRHWLAQVW